MRILLISCLLFSSGYLFSQSAPALSTTAEEVVVTGTRQAKPATERTQRVTVIDSAAVARANDLSQLLNEQAGIVINGAWSNPGKDRSIFLRNGANQFTLLLLDGQPLLDPSSLGGAVDLRLLDLAGIERIEILRGGSSVLYGSDAVAGVINLITKKDAAPQPLTLHLRAAAQSYNTLEGSLRASGGSKKFQYQTTLSYFTTDGISEALAPEGSPEPFAKDGARRLNAGLSLNYQPDEHWRIQPAVRIASFDGDYDAGSFLDGNNSYTNDLVLPSLTIDFDRDDWTYSGRYNGAFTDRVFNAPGGPFSFIGQAHQGEIFAVLDRDQGGSLTLGAQLRDETLDLEAADLGQPSVRTISPYAQYNLLTKGGFLGSLGLRYNNHSAFGSQLNWSVGAGVNTTKAWSTRLNLSSAFQSPTLDQLFGPFGANANLQPQISTSVELSTQLQDPEGSYQLVLTGFQRNIKDIIVFDFALGYQNQDELIDTGVEIELSGDLASTLRFSGNLTYVQGTLTSPGGSAPDVETKEFPRRPRTTGQLSLTYNPTTPLLARVSGIYVGDRPDVFFDEDFNRIPVSLDAYWLFNAYAEYQFLPKQQLTLFTEVRNLSNTDFVEVTGFSTQGTTLRAGISIAW